MAFPGDTKVLTKKGWKNIEDVGGKDRVLVRNFIGDAQFTKPFAIRRRQYSGKMITGGSRGYHFTVTPEHKIVYNDKNDNVIATTAEDVPAKRGTFLRHRARYAPDRYLRTQQIKHGDFEYSVNTLDWYKFVGYVLRRGNINRDLSRLVLYMDSRNVPKDMDLICPVLDSLGLVWNLTEPNRLVITRKSNVPYKLALMLGSRIRKKMYIPNKMINNCTVRDGSALIDTFIRASRRDGEGVDGTRQFSTTNTKLIDSLEILGLLCGYTISSSLAKPAGTKVPAGETKKDSYVVYVRKSVDKVSIIRKSTSDYEGKVYSIDIFEDQLLIKEGDSLPLWMKPK